MKRFYTALLLMAGLLAVPTAQAQFGVLAGLNYESVSDISISLDSTTPESAASYHFGVFYDIGFGPLDLRLSAVYREIGDLTPDDVSNIELSARAIDFPIDLRYNLLPLPAIKPYFLVGPVFSMMGSSDSDFDASLNGTAISGNAGLGIKLSLGSITLTPELRYAFGLSDFVGDTITVQGQEFSVRDGGRSNTAMLRVGIGF